MSSLFLLFCILIITIFFVLQKCLSRHKIKFVMQQKAARKKKHNLLFSFTFYADTAVFPKCLIQASSNCLFTFNLISFSVIMPGLNIAKSAVIQALLIAVITVCTYGQVRFSQPNTLFVVIGRRKALHH